MTSPRKSLAKARRQLRNAAIWLGLRTLEEPKSADELREMAETATHMIESAIATLDKDFSK